MKKIIFIMITITTLLTSGCFLKEKNLEQMLFPISLGLSYENNKYKVYLQILNTSTLSIIETETSQSETSFVLIHAEDEDLNKALSQIGLQSLTYISAIKLRSIVIHSSIFENAPLEYNKIARYFINTPIFRTKVQLFTTNKKLEDFYSVQYMLVGSSVYSHTNEEEPMIIRGYTKPSFLIDYLKSYEENKRMYHIPLMDVQENNIDTGDQSGELKKTKSYTYQGLCFTTYSQSNQINCLNKDEAIGYRWYSETKFVNVNAGDTKTPINTIIDEIDWKNSIENNTFNIKLNLKVIISFNLSNYSLEEIKEKLNNEIKKNILDTLSNAYNKDIDIYHLNDLALRKNKNLKYNLNNVNIDIDTTIINSTYYKN